jgi:aspartate carbamoyltransferase regulatory subunit
MLFIRYFIHIYKQQKKLFYFFSFAFCLYFVTFFLQLFDISYIQVSPFQGYGMYSERHQAKEKYTIIELEINDSIHFNLCELTQINRMMLCSPATHFNLISNHSIRDPRQMYVQSKLNRINKKLKHKLDYCTTHPKQKKMVIHWYKKYIAETFDIPVESFKFIEKTVDNNQQVIELKVILNG